MRLMRIMRRTRLQPTRALAQHRQHPQARWAMNGGHLVGPSLRTARPHLVRGAVRRWRRRHHRHEAHAAAQSRRRHERRRRFDRRRGRRRRHARRLLLLLLLLRRHLLRTDPCGTCPPESDVNMWSTSMQLIQHKERVRQRTSQFAAMGMPGACTAQSANLTVTTSCAVVDAVLTCSRPAHGRCCI